MTATEVQVSRRPWVVLVAMSAAVTIVIFNSSAINVALPTMATELGLSAAAMRLVVVIYSVTFAAMLLPAGYLCNRTGARTVLLLGLLATGLGGAAAAAVDNVPTIMISRAVMGVGAACVMPSTLALVVATTSEAGRSRAIAVWSAVSVAGAAGGPIIGGILVDGWGWNYIFMVSAVGSAAMATAILLLVRPQAKLPQSTVDVRLLGLAAGAITTFVLGVTIVSDEMLPGIALIAVACVLAAAAWAVSGKKPDSTGDEPPRTREQRREFLGASVSNMLLFFALAGTLFVLTQKLQFQFGLSPSTAGFAVAPVTLALLIGVAVSTPCSSAFGRRPVVVGGLVTAAIASITLSAFGGELSTVLGAVFFAGIGVGMALPLVTESMVASVPSHRVGEAAAVNDTMQEIGFSLGVAVLGSVLAGFYQAGLRETSTETGSLGATLAEADRLGDRELHDAAMSAFSTGSTAAFTVGAVFLVAGAIIAHMYLPSTDRTARNGAR
ncbi:MFS transporter [Rhodococcoides yunnanense]|jgi:DHA2 family multidrug resistance protein-like MFS transporter|uniref:MFS transporter n=1 Tax=Rhodococcoides yunnanense TaxID=278209 RepID=UPI0022B09AA7|nr:MFS transporter [Rhodococcus yunnanensis]MCZ4275358.1 MFS transporter [Rhodococcus yunnanensis]